MECVGVDIGGSGVRLARVELGGTGERHRILSELHRSTVDSVEDLVRAIQILGPADRIGVSVAGFVTAAGEVTTSRSQPWTEGPLRATLSRLLGVPVAVVHDGEAHLLASLSVIPLDQHPVLAVVSGTALAVAMTDQAGVLRRPVPERNWEFGDLRLSSSAAMPEVWWALGHNGLEALVSEHGERRGVARFGERLGSFAAELAGVFAARRVVLSGGNVATHRGVLLPAARSEFIARLPWWADAELTESLYLSTAGVVGAVVGAQQYRRL